MTSMSPLVEMHETAGLGSSHYALLLALFEEVAASLDLGEVLARCLRGTRRLVPFRGGSIALVEAGHLSIAVSDPPVDPDVGALRLPLGAGLSGRAAADGRPVYSPDLDTDDRVDPGVRFTGLNTEIHTYFAVPIVAAGDVVGVLQIDSPEIDGFSPTDREMITALAPLMGSAIQNARSYVSELETEERLEELERMRSDFISIVSHELRTPLTALLGFADLLARISDLASDREKVPYLIDRIESATSRLTRLVNELEQLAGLDAGSLDISSRPVDLRLLIDLVVTPFRRQRPVVLKLEEMLPGVVADPDHLGEALTALVDNAVKFSESGSPITVSASRRGDVVEIEVIDEGSGVPPELAQKVFERFAQVEPPSVRRAGGLGLGLPVARGLVERMGGMLSLVPGPGGRFVICLPLAGGV